MRDFDVAVVGAGPAGIAAALASAGSGANTLLVDENDRPGGQLQWRIGLTKGDPGGFDLEPAPGPVFAERLSAQLEKFENLQVELSTVAWGLFDGNVLGLSTESGADEIQARSIILATGSTDIALPFPGWTLPGVMTARAAQTFMHRHRVLPGERWVILGFNEEADELAEDLALCRAKVVAREGDVELIRASGINRLTHVEIDENIYEADSLAIALGRQPDAELALHAMVDSAFVKELGGFTVVRDVDGRTSEPGVYIAGDAAGIATLPELFAEGKLAGLAAAGASDQRLSEARDKLNDVMSDRRRAAFERLRTSIAGSH